MRRSLGAVTRSTQVNKGARVAQRFAVRAGEQASSPAPRPPGRRATRGPKSAAGLVLRNRELQAQEAAPKTAKQAEAAEVTPSASRGETFSRRIDAVDEEEAGEEDEDEDYGEGEEYADGEAMSDTEAEHLLELLEPPGASDPTPPVTTAAILSVLAPLPLPPALPPLLLTAVSRGRVPADPALITTLLTQLKAFTPLSAYLNRAVQVATALGLDHADAVGIVLTAPQLLLPSPAELAARAQALRATLELLEGEGEAGWVVQSPILLAVPAEVLDAKLGDVKDATGLSRKQSARLVTKWMFPELR